MFRYGLHEPPQSCLRSFWGSLRLPMAAIAAGLLHRPHAFTRCFGCSPFHGCVMHQYRARLQHHTCHKDKRLSLPSNGGVDFVTGARLRQQLLSNLLVMACKRWIMSVG